MNGYQQLINQKNQVASNLLVFFFICNDPLHGLNRFCLVSFPRASVAGKGR